MWVGCVVALVVGAGVLIDDIKKKKKDKNKDDYSRVCYDGPVYLASDVEIE